MNYILLRHIAVVVFSLSLSAYLVPLMSRIARRWGILDLPDGNIKTHKEGIPYLGGVAIYITFISSLALFYPNKTNILWLLLGVTLLLFLGLIDDLIIIKPRQKFLGQFVAVLCFFKGGIELKTEFLSQVFNSSISLLWLMLVTNAFNLIDVMDGLASLLAILTGASFFIIAILSKDFHLSLLILSFICPICVFFYFNKPSAKIYLGDSGSLFIGGFLAVMPLLFSWSEKTDYGYFVPVIILGIPLVEVAGLIIIRTLKGLPL